MRVDVNMAFMPQRVSGQQRYAREIAERLDGVEGFRAVAPSTWWAASTVRTWAWVQTVLPVGARSSVVLSMTARAPLWCRHHVLVVHDFFVLEHPEWFSRRYVWTHAPLLRAQLRSARAVVAVSQPVADQLEKLRGEPVRVAPNAPSNALLVQDDQASAVLMEHGTAPGSYFLAVGSRDPRKNLARLAQAYGLLSEQERAEHPLVLVGGGAGIYRNEVIEWPSGTIDAGYIDDDELRRLYRDARAVVFVSLAEGFGLPLVEAAAAGALRFVLSELPVFRWICGDGALYVDPEDPADVAQGLRSVLVDGAGETSIDLRRFTWDASAKVVADACRQVAAGRPVRAQAGPSVEAAAVPLPEQPKVAIVLASAGRGDLLGAVLANCRELAGGSFEIVVSVPDEASLPADRSLLDGVHVVVGTRGLAAQRNAGLDALEGVDIAAFFDDDAVVRQDYLSNAVAFLREHPSVVGLTGRVLLDGAVSGEIAVEAADEAIVRSAGEPASALWSPTRELYGCNFVVRTSASPGLRFDGRLPLYSWLEDHDFARRLMRSGTLAHVEDCVIVHRAAASGGRQAHVRLGYSQVMNPVYLNRKGSFPLWLAAQQIFRPVAKNVALAAAGPHRSWRRERLRGNLAAAADVLKGRITPERIVEL